MQCCPYVLLLPCNVALTHLFPDGLVGEVVGGAAAKRNGGRAACARGEVRHVVVVVPPGVVAWGCIARPHSSEHASDECSEQGKGGKDDGDREPRNTLQERTPWLKVRGST